MRLAFQFKDSENILDFMWNLGIRKLGIYVNGSSILDNLNLRLDQDFLSWTYSPGLQI